MISKILALSKSSDPGRFERTMVVKRGPSRGWMALQLLLDTAARINSLTDRPSLAALPLSSRYKGSGMSTVVLTSEACHIYG